MTRPTSTSSNFLSSETENCHDPQQVSIDSLADPTTNTGYEPKDLAEGDERFDTPPLFFHRPSFTSTYVSAESIATRPPESDLDDEQVRVWWLHHCTCRREKQVRTDHKFIILQEKT